MNIDYGWLCSTFLVNNDEFEKLIEECSKLYSTQYGIWSLKSPYNAGKRVKLSSQKIQQWLFNDCSAIYWARDNDKLIGYAIAIQLNVPNYGFISWVTQLVVHEDYRHHDIAKNLLHSIWGFTDHYAWGIVSANPYAIRALEKTTRRRSNPSRIKHNLRKIISIGIQNLPYINEQTEIFVTDEASRINTEFYVDHSDVENMINNVVTDTVPWTLGKLDEGWEWLAFTFRDQLPFELTEDEIMKMLEVSDKTVQNAYKRMNISTKHLWASHTEDEVSFIIDECGLKKGDTIIDFGCGHGRHDISLAQKGFNVCGIDYVEKNIEIANKKKNELHLEGLNFIEGDCRLVQLNKKVNVALCLYDVIGSYVNNDDNLKILKNIFLHLEEGGIALISVMNYELTYAIAKNTFILKDEPNKLLALKPSNIMENNGNIFNPDYYLLDNDTGIVYRREQFSKGRSLPVELIVRDKRFSMQEIKQMCKEVGFKVEYARFVNANDWITPLSSTNIKAKEILLKCRKL